ncbi:MAG: 6-bladed beta-propeller [Gemmatimonadota bacterium]
MRAILGVTVAAGALALAGCGGADAEAGAVWAGTIEDSAGVSMVTSSADGFWTDETRWQIEDVLRIGEAEGDPDYQFGLISGIAELSDGRIMVLDQQAQNVRIFSPAGVIEQTAGKAGSGPGEFGQGAAWLNVTRGDTVFVLDQGNQRVSRLLGDGSFDGSFPIDFQTSGFPVRVEARPSGSLIAQFRVIQFPGQDRESGDAILELAGDGTVLDTTRTMESGGTFKMKDGRPEFLLFAAEPSWSLMGEDELVFATNDRYRLETYGPDGALRRVISRPSDEVPVTDEDRNAFMEGMEKAWARFGMPDAQIEQLKSQMNFADVFPVFNQFRAGPSGSVWVQRLMTPTELVALEGEINLQGGGNLGGPDWDVFDSEGRLMGQVMMPDKYRLVSFTGDKILGVWRDEFDVQYVRILRVVQPS